MQLYAAKFNEIAKAIADGVAEGFGKAVQDAAEEKEDDEVVEKKTVSIDGKNYTCGCIEKAGENYMRLRDLTQAGYGITYDANTQIPGVIAPQTRVPVPDGDSAVQAAIDKLQTVCGLEEQTIEYLLRYKYGDDLIQKIAAAL